MAKERTVVGQFMYDLLGPSTQVIGAEIARRVTEFIERRRQRNLASILGKAKQVAVERDIDFSDAPPEFVIRMLISAADADDETIHTLWAHLLAAAATRPSKYARPLFVTALASMTPTDARVFDALMSGRQPPAVDTDELDAAVLTLSSLGLIHHSANYGIDSRTQQPMVFGDWSLLGSYVVAKSHLGVFLHEALSDPEQ